MQTPARAASGNKNLILEARDRNVFVEKRFVVKLKVARDVHSVGTWHAIVALGAWNGGPFPVLLLQVRDQVQIRRLKRMAAGVGCAIQVGFHLVHVAHPA